MNLILIIFDSLRADHMGCYGNTWIKTPNFDTFANESVIFERCFPDSLPTIPVRRTIITGNRLFPFRDWEPKIGDNVTTPGWAPLRETDITISEILLNEGYRTALITDNLQMFKPAMNFHRSFKEWRWIRGQEFDQYRSAAPSNNIDIDHFLTPSIYGTYSHAKLIQYLSNTAFRKGEEDYFAPMVFTEGMRWLEENQDAEKFFLWIDCFDPHEPWDPPQEYRDIYNPGYKGKEVIISGVGEASKYLTEEELNHTRALYAGEVTMVDKWFGKFMIKIEKLGLLDNTLVVVVSDHGHPIGEHGIIHKMPYAMYPTVMDIAFMIRHPERVSAGKRVNNFVYQHDLFPTMLSLLGVKYPHRIDGENIWPLVTSTEGPAREFVTCGFQRYVWIRDDKYTYISQSDGATPQLFDLKSDPGHFTNIAADHPEIVKQMYEKLIEDAGGPLRTFEELAGYTANSSFRSPLNTIKKEG
jgi:arylsulfatase A-like enzyme